MALSRALFKRLARRNRQLEHSPIVFPAIQKSLDATEANLLPTTDNEKSSEIGVFRRFFQQRRAHQELPTFLSLPVGEKLRERMNGARVLRINGLMPVLHGSHPADSVGQTGITVRDARKILRSSQLEKLRSALRMLPENSITYPKFVQICTDIGSNREQGLEFAKMLDESGNVIVLGDVVFLRPELVAKTVEKLVSESIAMPDDPRRHELEDMEKEKAVIDRRAETLVLRELNCGLGFLVVQTLGFMRLTFWELSWDVMEPICFFVTSSYFALAYGFFLRTAKEPTFEGYFQSRFRVKQRKLLESHNFDMDKYIKLCKLFYPNYPGFLAPRPESAQPNGHGSTTLSN